MRLIAVAILLCLFAAAPASAHDPGDTRTVTKTVRKKTGSVLKTVGDRRYACVRETLFEVVTRQTYQCRSTRKLPFCDAPGANRRHCPDVCSNGEWVNTTTREKFIRDLVVNCNPLEDPFGRPTPRAR